MEFKLEQKQIPLRMCIACRGMKPKNELIRLVKDPDNQISIDYIGKSQGRGTYICMNHECIEKLQKSKGLERAFRMSISKTLYNSLLSQLGEMGGVNK